VQLQAVRVLSPGLRTTLSASYRASPTMRALVDERERSDLIVYVMDMPMHAGHRVLGTTRFVLAAGGRRYLRVIVSARGATDVQAATLGHELRHAVEIARASSVIDLPSFGAFYRNVGQVTASTVRGTSYETEAAQRAGERVRAEIREFAELGPVSTSLPSSSPGCCHP
jgi:hypothetical protein